MPSMSYDVLILLRSFY